MYMKLSLVLTSLLAFPLLATPQLPSATIRVPVIKTIRADNVNAFATALAKYGLHVNSVLQTRGYTLLHVAVMEGSPKIVEHLIKNGAEVNVTNAYDATPLDEVPFGKTEIATLLEQAGAKYGKGFRIKATPTDRGTSPASLPDLDADLLAAAQEGATEEVLWLLERGANIEAKGENGWTALMYATQSGRTETVEWLIEREANIEAKDDDGYTALMIAAKLGNVEKVALLLKHGANIEAKDDDRRTALMIATQLGKKEVIALLIKYGAKH